MKRTIVLLTDFGTQDSYVGVMKGVILTIQNDTHLVDLTHHIKPQNIVQAATVLKNAYKFFPAKTVFCCVVDPGVGTERHPVIVKTKDYTFVGPDNGLFAPIIAEEEATVYTISNTKYFLEPVSQTFHGRDIFAPVAAHVSKGVAVTKIGTRQKDHVKLNLPQPKVDQRRNCVIGQIVDIDRFGNLITNVKPDFLKDAFVIHLKKKAIDKLSVSYGDAPGGDLLAIIGSHGFLEFSVNQGSAEEVAKSKIGDTFKIDYKGRTGRGENSSHRKRPSKKTKPQSQAQEKKTGSLTPFDFYEEASRKKN
ncbi:MAG: SAM-dependent chlorinase/fluorinase [Candidatus Omnitrophica bacterium]|nr:SAM-dependent chlorinase/fluorinase [Candidatus Omnitrophota bacterium]